MSLNAPKYPRPLARYITGAVRYNFSVSSGTDILDPVSAVHSLPLSGHKTIGHEISAKTAIGVSGRGAQKAHRGKNLGFGGFRGIYVSHTGHKLVLGIGARAITDLTFFLGQLLLEQQRVV